MTATQDDLRRERLREFDGLMGRAGTAVSALAMLVQGREARAGADGPPLEVAFTAADNGPTPLPAGLWVALRRGDIQGALDLLVDASETSFVVGEREEMGSGYRLETVAETRATPDVGLLQAQLAAVLDIPPDVVALLASWGADDPRTATEVNALLDARFSAGGRAGTAQARPVGPGTLSMSVDELADVLLLSAEQVKVLATLARRSAMTITPSSAAN
ncbi:MAG: hypothetical protein ABI775_08815 [Pseudonocardiales bacterium]|nr:hypothetical protein [Actinomycetota bacterium]